MKQTRSDLVFRLHKPADTAIIVTMINQDRNHMLYGTTAELFEQDLDEPGERIRDNTFVVELGEVIVGYLSLCFVERTTHFSVYCFATLDMKWRRQGIGTTMLSYIFDRLEHAADQESKPIHFIHRALTSIPGEIDLGLDWGMEEQNSLEILCLRDWGRLTLGEPPTGFSFRSPTLDDAESWAAIYNDAFGGNKTLESVAREFQGAEFSPDRYLICIEEATGKPVGLICTTIRGNLARIPTIAVMHEWQRHGIGRAMLTEMLRRLQAAGATEVRLSVESRNNAAQALYAECGFEQDFRRIHYSTIFAK